MKISLMKTMDNVDFEDLQDAAEVGMILHIVTNDRKEIPFAIIGMAEDRSTCTIQQVGMLEERPFQEERRKDGKNMNEYEGSDIQMYLKWEYREQFQEDFLKRCGEFNLLPAEDYDPDTTRYPYYQDRKNLTKYDPEGYATWYWTSSPYVGGASTPRYVRPTGSVSGFSAYYSAGVAPACIFNLESV